MKPNFFMRLTRLSVIGTGIALFASITPFNTSSALAAGTGIISGTIYNDTANDGVGAYERAAPGVTVYLDADNDGVFDNGETSLVTTGNGQYDFFYLAPGTYAVRLNVPHAANIIHPGSVTVTTGQNGRHDGAVVFGGSVSGTMFLDLDGDKEVDADDVGAYGQVSLDWDHDGRFTTGDFTVWAHEGGRFVFPSVPDGTYLMELSPSGVGVITPDLTSVQVVNGNAVTVNATVVYSGSISGRVYVDINRNSAYDQGEGLPDIDVTLLRSRVDGDLEVHATADDGSFSFLSVADMNNGYVYLQNPEDPDDRISFGGYAVTNGSHFSKDIVIELPDVEGYRVAAANGEVFNYGNAKNHGSMAGKPMNAPIISMASLPDGSGYWLFGRDGGVFTFGNAKFHGSTGNLRLNAPIVAMAVAPDGDGYWLVASDGGVFAFGSATFHGSMGGKPLNKPIVGMSADPDGDGYWLVASDGGIFSFDAEFAGSTGGMTLNKPITGMAADADGDGYWLVASDGGIFSFRSTFFGSAGSLRLNSPIVAIASAPMGDGYYLLSANGEIYPFPSRRAFFGSPATRPNVQAVGISVF